MVYKNHKQMRNINEHVALGRNGWGYDTEDNKHFPEAVVYTKRITGRVTEARAERVLEYTRRFNEANEGLYGFSPNGYPYTCGCERDCCGCLTSIRMNVFFGVNVITLKYTRSYNY